VAVECVPTWNTDGIVTEGEVENCSVKQLSVSPAGNIIGALYHKLQTESSAPEDG